MTVAMIAILCGIVGGFLGSWIFEFWAEHHLYDRMNRSKRKESGDGGDA